MNKFKVGERVKLVKELLGYEAGSEFNVVHICRNESVWIDLEVHEVSHKEMNNYYAKYFDLVEEKKMFDLKKEKWFIHTPTPEISEAVQLWLFEQGLQWRLGGQDVRHTNKSAIGGMQSVGNIGFADPEFYAKEGCQEIKFTFKAVVDSVEYPVVESEQQKRIRELEETIATAQRQIAELKEMK